MSDLPIIREARQRPRTATFGLLTTGKDGDPMTLTRLSLHTVCYPGRTLNLQTIKAKNEKDRLSNESFS
jgi:hypothetical protein